ncbi:invasion associated locus B family protein [Neorhizobium sp. LjRoot104]|uniref:invasion associated locus B family protein n=1 Tax=Neorhizobium sp. LjRoot104 TaxID=3342254 RepID=UPI003F4F9CF5
MIKSFDAWGVYSYSSSGKRQCYVLSSPQQMLPTGVDHGANYFLVSPGPSGRGYYPQTTMGYDLRPGSELTATIDSRSFAMMVKEKSGWTRAPDDDIAMINAMKKGHTLMLRAVSRRGTQTSYSYSLSGLTAALAEAARCR